MTQTLCAQADKLQSSFEQRGISKTSYNQWKDKNVPGPLAIP